MKATILIISVMVISMDIAPAFRNQRTASLSGNITDLFGSPLADAVIEVSATSSKNISVRSNRDGAFTIDNLPPSAVTVTASARGFRPETRTLQLRLGEKAWFGVGLEPMSIADHAPVRLTGTIRSESKVPLKEVAVTVLNAFNNRLVKTVKTDGAGHYRVEFENGGQYIAYASRSGFFVSSSTLILPAAPPRQAELNFVLAPINESIYGKSP